MIDELNVALEMKLLPEEEIKNVLQQRENTHLVVTGRYAKDFMIERLAIRKEMETVHIPSQQPLY